MWAVRWFRSKQYNWSGISQQPSLLAKAKRGLMQFTPYTWDQREWAVFSSPARCIQVGARLGGRALGVGAGAARAWRLLLPLCASP